jgi:hypothetical protein
VIFKVWAARGRMAVQIRSACHMSKSILAQHE